MVSEMCAVSAGKACKNPLVSVGIPTYNRPEGLHRALKCITGQTYKNLEIIVSDNCSPGTETEAVVREFMAKDSRIQYYRQEENQGSAFNFKFVLEKATSGYFMWAADDDEWEPLFIDRVLDFLIKNPDVSVAMTGSKQIDVQGIIVAKTQFRDLISPNYNQFRVAFFSASIEMTHGFIDCCMYGLYRTTILKKIARNLDNSFAKDWLIICVLLLSTKVGYVDELLFVKRTYFKGIAERYPDEELGKSYGDPFNYLKLFLNFGPYLLRSSNIPLNHKVWIPFLVIRMGTGVGRIYIGQAYQIVIATAKRNSFLNRIIIGLTRLD